MLFRFICWSICFHFVFTASVVNVGVFFDEDEEGGNWDVVTDIVGEKIELSAPEIHRIDADSFKVTNLLCSKVQTEGGVAAIFGPRNRQVSQTLETACSHLDIPYIITTWAPKSTLESQITLNVYPDPQLLSQAYASLIASLDWYSFAILYYDDDALIRLQDVLKIQEYKEDSQKDNIILKKLYPTEEKSILKAIGAKHISQVVLDCPTDKVLEVLGYAKEVNLLTDFTSSFFLTSLDAHTLDFSSLESKSNITTLRLFNPQDEKFQRLAMMYYPHFEPNQITVEQAVTNDAILLLAHSIKHVVEAQEDGGDIEFKPLLCNSTEKLENPYGLAGMMKEIEITEALTGTFTLKDGQRQDFELELIEIDKLERPIGIWKSAEQDRVEYTRNATERETEIQERLKNHKFIVTSRIIPPYLFENTEKKDAIGNARYYGYSIDLIDAVAKEMNVSYEFTITFESSPPNLVKDLIERRADLAICDFTITPERREVIDFSMPFMTLGIGILHKKPDEKEEANIYGFLGPLSTTVWIYIGALYLLMSFLLVFIARMSTQDWENPHPCDDSPTELENIWNLKNCCWLTLGSITTQGCDILPKGVCSRIATASWWFFSLIIASSYTANLAAFLTMSRLGSTIDSVEELASQSKVKYGCLKGGSTCTFFEKSNNSLYQRMWSAMEQDKSVFEDSNTKGVERILSTKNDLYAFIMESTGIDYEMERKCELRRIGGLLDSKSYGIGMPMNAAYRHEVNKAVLHLQEIGKLIELKEKWWKKEREGDPCPQEPPSNDSLALENVGGVFIVLGVGVGLAFLIAILEFLWNVYNVSVEEHISFLEALKVEVKFACNILITKKRAKPLLSESSSSKSSEGETSKSNFGLLTTAASVLNINTSILHKLGSQEKNLDGTSVRSRKSKSSSHR